MSRRHRGGRSTNETNEMWREVHAQAKQHRDRREGKTEILIARAVAAGTIDARQLSEFHWRLWVPSRPERTIDLWPRSGRWMVTGAQGESQPGGLPKVLVELGATA